MNQLVDDRLLSTETSSQCVAHAFVKGCANDRALLLNDIRPSGTGRILPFRRGPQCAVRKYRTARD